MDSRARDVCILKPERVSKKLIAGDEMALLDVREQGVHGLGHPLFASSAPLSRLEIMIGDLVPRRNVPIVLLDGGDEGLAEKAHDRLQQLGYTDVAVLEGGGVGWREYGGELFSGINVTSKAFGEFVEHHYDTPRMSPEQLIRHLEEKKDIVILDSRPFEEYRRMSIPAGINVPGAELAWRVGDLAPNPGTLVVVNCAGRTRSIIGCQSLRNAGIANEVVALKDGTMGWELAGFEVERGATRIAPEPTEECRQKARAATERVAKRFQVQFATRSMVEAWRQDTSRTLYMLDVRSREEFELRHIHGSRHAPGGQLVQATDEYLGVRNSRVVLIDPQRVRSVMSASWLNQMGWDEVYVLEPEGPDGFSGWRTEIGRRTPTILGLEPWATIEAEDIVEGNEHTVLDLSSSLGFRRRHIPGAWWAVRSRLDQAKAKIADVRGLILTSEDGILAQLAAAEAAALWPGISVRVLRGGNASWFGSKRSAEAGIDRATTAINDVWYNPYDHDGREAYEKQAREYLSWEIGLVEQIKREPALRFRLY